MNRSLHQSGLERIQGPKSLKHTLGSRQFFEPRCTILLFTSKSTTISFLCPDKPKKWQIRSVLCISHSIHSSVCLRLCVISRASLNPISNLYLVRHLDNPRQMQKNMYTVYVHACCKYMHLNMLILGNLAYTSSKGAQPRDKKVSGRALQDSMPTTLTGPTGYRLLLAMCQSCLQKHGEFAPHATANGRKTAD